MLKSLLDKGLVKLGNFRNNPRKLVSYAYLLTPVGIEEKSRLAVRFVISHLEEYDRLRQVFADKLSGIHKKGHRRIILVGPRIVRDFLISIIKEGDEDITLVGECSSWDDLNGFDSDSFEIALLSDDTDKSIEEICAATKTPLRKIMTLW